MCSSPGTDPTESPNCDGFTNPTVDGSSAQVLGSAVLLLDVSAFARAKDEFIATVSHELRTPLTSILGCSELLHDGDGGELTDVQARLVDTIRRNSERLTAVVNELLSLPVVDFGPISSSPESR